MNKLMVIGAQAWLLAVLGIGIANVSSLLMDLTALSHPGVIPGWADGVVSGLTWVSGAAAISGLWLFGSASLIGMLPLPTSCSWLSQGFDAQSWGVVTCVALSTALGAPVYVGLTTAYVVGELGARFGNGNQDHSAPADRRADGAVDHSPIAVLMAIGWVSAGYLLWLLGSGGPMILTGL